MTHTLRRQKTLAACALPRLVLAALVAGALLIAPRAADAYGAAEGACLNGRYAAAAKYSACVQKVTGKYLGVAGVGAKAESLISKCRVKYAGTWAKLQARASGTGATCDAARFAVSGGTVTDNLTGLQWEQKTDDATVHDKDNVYTWCANVAPLDLSCDDGPAADGTAYTSFLATLNGGSCFAGQCDWRLPTHAELLTILSEPYPCTTSPCIDQGIFGPTLVADFYWSATTHVAVPDVAWVVSFATGEVFALGSKSDSRYVRAVRGGL